MTTLTEKACTPCEVGAPPLAQDKIEQYFKELDDAWELEEQKLRRTFKFKDFKEAVVFFNKVAEVAEAEGHHPDVYVFYDTVKLELFTHAIGGLSENDFIVAAKIDQIA